MQLPTQAAPVIRNTSTENENAGNQKENTAQLAVNEIDGIYPSMVSWWLKCELQGGGAGCGGGMGGTF